MTLTIAGAQHTLNSLLGSNDPTEFAFALFTSDPEVSFDEPTGSSYSRVTKTNDSSLWNAPVDRTVTNADLIQFPNPQEDWGRIRGMGMYDPSDGTLLAWGKLTTERTIRTGNIPRFPSGTISVRQD